MAITVNIVDECPQGHGRITVTANAISFSVGFMKSELSEPITQEEFDIGHRLLIRFLARASNVSTWNALKADYNNRSIAL